MNTNLRLDRLLGREIYTGNNRRLGRLEEFRAERRGAEWIVIEYLIGAAGMAERLGLGVRMVLGINRPSGYVATWDQLDLSNPDRLRITCPVKDLRRR